MRVFAFSDWRVQSIDELISFVKDLDKKPDVILYCGDDVRRFGDVRQGTLRADILNVIKNTHYKYGFITYDSKKTPIFLWVKNIQEKNVKETVESILNIYKRKNDELEYVRFFGPPGSGHYSRIRVRSRVFLDRIVEILNLGKNFTYCKYTIEEILEKINLKIEKLDKNTFLAIFSMNNSVNIKPNKFEEIATYTKHGLFGIIGNDCSKLDKHILKGQRVFDIHECPQIIDDFIFIGQEGASRDVYPPLGFVLYSENEIENHLDQQIRGNKNKKIILVSHSPPHGILDTGIRFSEGGSIGSSAIRKFIEQNEVILNVCGHAHYMGGKSENWQNAQL